MKLKTLNGASIRSEFTAFECEALKHAAAYCEAGQTFTGVPTSNEERYRNSSQQFKVLGTRPSVTVLWINRDKELRALVVDGDKKSTTNKNTKTDMETKASESNDMAATDMDANDMAATDMDANDMAATDMDATDMAATNETQGQESSENEREAMNTVAKFFELVKSETQSKMQKELEKAKAEKQNEIDLLKDELKKASEENKALTAKLEEKAGSGTTIVINAGGEEKTTKLEKVVNPSFERVLRYVAAHKNVYLYGPAGSGKNVICEDVANALGVPFYYQNTILTKFDITGYKNAIGEFEESEFFKAWTNGGVIMFDEVDNSTAEAIIALNAALANGYYSFPGIGRVKKHDDFYCIAAGNTNGQGATTDYCGRYKMDESSRDRFAFVKIDYCAEIEESIVPEDKMDVLDFVREIRSMCKQSDISLICGYRAIRNLVEFYDCDPKEVIEDFILRGIEKDAIVELAHYATTRSENKYINALKQLAQ